MENYFIPFFLGIIFFRYKELRRAIKIQQNVIMEIIYLLLIIILSVLLYLFIKRT
jgi:hypothetical protein